jgi:O-antigen/teichoic acid export membrane protein
LAGIGFVFGLAVGVLLYLGVHFLVNRKVEITKGKNSTRNTILGIVVGLVIAFLFGLPWFNPVG